MNGKDRFAVYSLRDDPEIDSLRGASYNDLLRAKIQIDPDNYTQLFMSGMHEDDTAYRIFDRLRRFPPPDFPGDPIHTSDILTIIVDEWPTAFYVDGDQLILISDFYKASGDNRIVCLDDEEYVIADKAGTWIPITQVTMKGIPFYEMRNANDPHGMHILVSFDGKVVAENFRTLTQDVADRTGQHLELWQKYYENGEYVRSLADYAGAMVNYSRVDGSRANQEKDMTEEIRQAQVGRASGKSKDEQARAESQQKQTAETQRMSYKERIARAKQEADSRVAQRNGQPDPQTEKEHEEVSTDRSFEQEILDHISKVETQMNRRISSLERKNNKQQTVDDDMTLEKK